MLLPDLPQRNKHGSPVDVASNGKFLKLGINIYVSRFERGISNSFSFIGKCAFHILSQDIKSL